jgi:hypothetical protein
LPRHKTAGPSLVHKAEEWRRADRFFPHRRQRRSRRAGRPAIPAHVSIKRASARPICRTLRCSAIQPPYIISHARPTSVDQGRQLVPASPSRPSQQAKTGAPEGQRGAATGG